MIILLITWGIVFVIVYFIGLSTARFVNKFLNAEITKSLDQDFFLGFSVSTVLAAYASILLPLNITSLLAAGAISLIGFTFFRRSLIDRLKQSLTKHNTLVKADYFVLGSLIVFISVIASSGINKYDTGLYYSQSIQWISKYSVVPGLGNLHSRLAFNSILFPVSALFTIDTPFTGGQLIIYPINAVCLILLCCKIYLQCRENYLLKSWQKLTFYLTTLFLCLVYLTIWASSAAPDVSIAILVIYIFILVFERSDKSASSNVGLVSILIFVAISIKLSAVLLILLLMPYVIDSDRIANIRVITITGLLAITPFLIRNYYLSGYLIFPFPPLDIFQVDWKIPMEKVVESKAWIESWARIPRVHYSKVLAMDIDQWIGIWFANKDPLMRLVLLLNTLVLPITFGCLIKRNRMVSLIGLIVLANLCFWFSTAPDPRFVYGFLFVGCSITLSFFVGLFIENGRFVRLFSSLYFKSTVFLFLAVVLFVAYRIELSRRDNMPSLIIPGNFPTPDLKFYQTNFIYSTPADGDQCFNVPIPCTPYQRENLVLMGDSFQSGFRILNDQ